MSANVCTQAEFAARQGWHRSTVTRLKQAGRLVMQGGRVDVAASLVRIEETGGMRFDVAERHAANRTQQQAQQDGQKTAAAPSAGVGEGEGLGAGVIAAPAPDAVTGERRSDAQARKESALADLAEMDVKQKRGELMEKKEALLAGRDFSTEVRSLLTVLPDQLAPLTTPSAEFDENHALIAEHSRLIMESLAHALLRYEAALSRVGGA